jgi:hypothetical protein
VDTLSHSRNRQHRADRSRYPSLAADYLAELIMRDGQAQDDSAAATPGTNLDRIWIIDKLASDVSNEGRQAGHRQFRIDDWPLASLRTVARALGIAALHNQPPLPRRVRSLIR